MTHVPTRYSRSHVGSSVTACVAAATLGGLLLNALMNHSVSDLVPYNTSEFLISYQGGFVRRGLLGEVLYRLPVANLEQIELSIKLGTFVVYAVALAALAVSIHRYTQSLVSTLLIVLQPFLLGFPVLTFEWLRKDTLLVLLFYVSLGLLRHVRLPRTGLTRLIVFAFVNLLSIVAILSHELYGLAALPALVVVCASTFLLADHSLRRSFLRSICVLVPSFACFALVLLHKGSDAIALDIVTSWAARGIVPGDERAVRELGMSFAAAVAKPGDMPALLVGPTFYVPVFWLLVFPLSGLLLAISSTCRGPTNGFAFGSQGSRMAFMESCGCLCFTAACCLPLFALGSDYGRWIFIWLSFSAGLVFSDSRRAWVDTIASVAPRVVRDAAWASADRVYRSIRRILDRPFRELSPLTVLSVSLLLLPLPSLMMQACCRFDVFQFSLAFKLGHLLSRILG
jgi:hypothetical protein